MSIIDYKASPTAIKFHESDAFVKGIRGPFGSGKSVACCFEIFMRAQRQTPSKDGIRRSRWIVARNTQPQLETTTIKTWLDWFPEHIFGKMSRKPPFTHHIKLNDIELEVIFLALDKPEDVKKLLSFEVTGIWFNEAREMEYDIIAGGTGRVGRYPSKKDKPDDVPDDKWPEWHGIIMDTNPPTDDHWWYKMAEENAWAVDKFGNPIDPENVAKRQRWEFWAQPSGLASNAENIDNLPGGYDYYRQQLGGKTEEWIRVYVHGEYGFIKSGLPVYGNCWNPDSMTAEKHLKKVPSGIITVGVDSSGRHPAAVFIQRTPRGQLQVIHEVCVTDEEGMGAVNFAQLLKREMNTVFPNHDFDIYGDPAGSWGSQNDERTYFDILHAQGIFIKPSPGLRISERIETVMSTMNRNVDGHPALVIHPSCKVLLRGMNGGYRYKKLNTSGSVRYEDKPDKNRYSDVQDALQYALCGLGETGRMYGRNGKRTTKTKFAKSKFKIF
jgi:hypothetical protein